MIEGIVIIFVILIVLLTSPFIKDWYYKYYGVNESDFRANIIMERDGVQYKFDIEYGEEFPENPVTGKKFMNTKDNTIYNFDGKNWLPFIIAGQGDIWFW